MSGTEPDPNSLSQAIADLEAVDVRLTAMAAAYPAADSGGSGLAAPIQESRTLVRAAINMLSGALASEQVAGGAKRRVKIKAASETISAGETRTEVRGKSTAAATKSAGKGTARNGRGTSAATPARTVKSETEPVKPMVGSLLARLGTVSDAAPAEAQPPAAKSTSISAEDAATRLARLEAEIASLTDTSAAGTSRDKPAALDGTPAANAASARVDPAKPAGPPPSTKMMEPDGDDDDAEIVIVTAGVAETGPPVPATDPARENPRVYRTAPPPADDDAEVEIVQHGADGKLKRSEARPELKHTPENAGKPSASGKWRFFRGSR